MNRRKFIKLATGALTVPVVGTAYSFWEAASIRVTEHTIAVPNLPNGFVGKKVAVLSDIHHGPFNGLAFVQEAVRITNALKPDWIALPGDFVHHGPAYTQPCFQALAELQAPLGIFAVPGNHDMHTDFGRFTRFRMLDHGLMDVTNTGCWIQSGSDRLRIAGVDELYFGKPDLQAALKDVSPQETAILLCHNPDYVEGIKDPRVGLVLSGHMHGGQVYIPGIGAPWAPSRYGQKYLYGLVQGPVAQVFVSGGLGTVRLPIRIGSHPEINLLTLRQEATATS